MMGMRNLRIGVVVSLFVGLCYASPVSLKASVRETDGVSCAASLSRAGLVRLGVDSTSTKKCRPLLRRKRIAGFDLSGVPRRMGRVCVALNEDGDKVELRFKIDDIGFGFTQVRGGVYATEDEIPTDFDEAYATSESFPKEVEKHTLVLALDEIDRDCCRDGIIVMWTAVVGPTTYAGNVPKQMTVHPSGGTSVTAFCKRRAGTKQRICEMDFTCSGCPLDETGISGGTCIVSTCPHVGSLVAPIDCTLRNARINESCDHFGDLGTLQKGSKVTADCVCQPCEEPAQCTFDSCGLAGQPDCEELYPGDACGEFGTVKRVLGTTTNQCSCEELGGLTCTVVSDSLATDIEVYNSIAGQVCTSAAGAPGVVLALPDGAYRPGMRFCSCTAPCEYIPDPLGCPECVAKGYGGQACSSTVVGVDGSVEGVLLEKDEGICYCAPALEINNQCNYERNSTLDDSRSYPRAIQDEPYRNSCTNWDASGVLLPLAEPVGEYDCECQQTRTCQCPPGVLGCKFTGQSAGDSCTEDFGSGNLVQDKHSGACACAIQCTLQSPECTRNCDTYTGERCTLQEGSIEGVATGVVGDEGVCFCQSVEDCPSSQCYHRDAGCIPVGEECISDYLQTLTLKRASGGGLCRCENSCNQKTTNGALDGIPGYGCAVGPLAGVVVESHPGDFISCRCRLDKCTLSSCEGDGCETFEGEFGEPCDNGNGVITVDQRGNCKCTQKCVNIDCPAGIAGCSPQQGKIGDICVPKTDGDSTGLLTPGDNPGECTCATQQCSYRFKLSEGSGGPSGTTIAAYANPGDTCHDRARLGTVVEDVSDPSKCTCETGFEANRCYNVVCRGPGTCNHTDRVLGDRCPMSTGLGEFAFVTESETVCACKEKL